MSKDVENELLVSASHSSLIACYLICFVLFVVGGRASAQISDGIDFSLHKPQISAVRINREEAPKIDGDLSDPIWSKTKFSDEFFQVEPFEGAEPTQPTSFAVAYDDENLYIGIYNYDDDPAKLVRNLFERDFSPDDDDTVRIIIDPFGTFRDGFFFATNPNGALAEALLENNTSFREEWNTVWDVKTKVVHDGWIAEFKIPFRSIAFSQSLEAWNFQVVRLIRRNNEEVRWSNIDQAVGQTDLSNPGQLTDVQGVKSGLGLEAQIFLTGASTFDHIIGTSDVDLDPSGNLFYKVTPSLTASLTINTDFSDAPLDSRQVNTGRFDLFFPETRDFFLQDIATFEFGGAVFDRDSNGLPFFTRNIGLVGDLAPDIIAGGKLSGKLGVANIGLTSVRTDNIGTIGEQQLSGGRLSLPILAESKIGIIAANGDPTGESNNSVFGLDFQYRNTTSFPGVVTGDFVFIQNFNEDRNDNFLAVDLEYDSEQWNFGARAKEIGESYNPALGFVNRTGIRDYGGDVSRVIRPNGGWLRVAEIGVFTNVVTNLSNSVLDRNVGLFASFDNNSGDNLFFEVQQVREVITEPFLLAGELLVPAGDFENTVFFAEVETTTARPYSFSLGVFRGGSFDGNLLDITAAFEVKPNRFLRFAANYEFQRFELGSGGLDIHIGTLETTIVLSSRFNIRTDIQYDNISEAFAVLTRVNWEPRPQTEIFLSIGHLATIEEEDFPRNFEPESTGIALRIGNRFRF